MTKLAVAAGLVVPSVALAHPGHNTSEVGHPEVVVAIALVGLVVAGWKLVRRTIR